MYGVTHASTRACMHECTHVHMHVKHDNHDKHGCLHGGSHLQLLYMYILALCMCICMCMNVGACGGIPRHTHTHKSQDGSNH